MNDDLIVHEVPGSVAEVVARLAAALERRGVTVFATIDHAAGARAAGLDLADETVVLFGDPGVGTGLMQDDPRAGLDLPLRMLVWNAGGTTFAGYRDPRALAAFRLVDHAGVPARLGALLESLASELGGRAA